jgi:hypothetical protein
MPRTVAAWAAEQVVDRRLQGFAFDIPKRHVDGCDGRHGYGAATPICAAIEILPYVFRLKRIPADQARNDVVLKIGSHGKFTPLSVASPNP